MYAFYAGTQKKYHTVFIILHTLDVIQKIMISELICKKAFRELISRIKRFAYLQRSSYIEQLTTRSKLVGRRV